MKILWNLLRQYIYIYIYIYKEKKNTNERLKKEKKKTVATGQIGTVATVQNLKKKKSGSPKWHCRCTVQKHWMNSAKTLKW